LKLEVSSDVELRERAAAACPRPLRGHTAVGVVSEGICHRATLCDADETSPDGATWSSQLPVGCLAKIFTATLVAQAVSRGLFTFDALVADLLAWPKAGPLSGVIVKHLLNHTHGLDGSALTLAPRLGNGRLDADALLAEIARTDWPCAPGEIYSYSNMGPWIAAAILEQHTGKSYEQLLRESLFAPLGIEPSAGDGSRTAICPATGRGLTLSLDELLTFVQWSVAGSASSSGLVQQEMLREIVPIQGWSVVRGAGLGWKYFGGAWFGHNVHAAAAGLALRINPAERTGIVVVSTGYSAALLLARLAGTSLPEFYNLQFPRRLSLNDRRTATEMFTGTYQNLALRLSVERSSQDSLDLRMFDRIADPACVRPVLNTHLVPCAEDLFLFEHKAGYVYDWIQFIPSAAREGRHAWNGREIIPRVS
jgi:CubicO group peptidase (beta-lactamase class C family)